MSIAIIAAMGKGRVIGVKNRLPWHIAGDLQRFKKLTMGHVVLMGRKTYESIGGPLAGRKNVVLTRDKNFNAENVCVFHSLEEALSANRGMEIFIIGGAEVFRQALPLADVLHLTLIDREFEGDAFFPEFDIEKDFNIEDESPVVVSKKGGIPFRFVMAVRSHQR